MSLTYNNIDKVVVDIEKWRVKSEEAVAAVVTRVVEAMWESVIVETPVDTGFTLSNWNVSNVLNPAVAGAGVKKDRKGDYNRRDPMPGFSPKKPIFIFNSTWYIGKLESINYNPRPKNAGRGQMIAKAVAAARNGLHR